MAEAKDGHILLKVVDQNDEKVAVRMKKKSNFTKLKKMYCDRVGIPLTSLRFIFDSRRIGDMDTPEKLEMEDGDVIEVYQEQTGGLMFGF